MIDIHSHILPGVDDGVQTLDDALEMLRRAAASGVTTQVLTPHIQPGRFDNTRASLTGRFEAFQAAVDQSGIDIELRLAAEVHAGPQILEMVANDTLPWLGNYRGYRTFLLEFPYTRTPAGSLKLVHWLIDQGLLPVIAHPERCREWQCRPERLQPYIEAGCPIQITGGSLLGKFGSEAKALSHSLLTQAKLCIAVATDCHNLAYRPPNLGTTREYLEDLFDEAAANRLVDRTPHALAGIDEASR